MNRIMQIWHSQNSPSYCLLTPLFSPKDKKCNVCMYECSSPVQTLMWRLHYLSTEALEYSASPRFITSATAPDPPVDLTSAEDDPVDSARPQRA